MDPGAPLDYALFHLTPTRTRCDLLVFSGGGSGGEKIASGLLEPFLTHLRCARDQIPKGGYSITLRPPSPHSPWFTKPTLERFVRFVSTPEILERVVSIEREIVQIENSIRMGDLLASAAAAPDLAAADQGNMTLGDGNTKKTTLLSKLKAESDSHDAAQGESSKLCLQRVLETRKAVLQKEQGMSYARAAVTGFELANIEDLLLFADAFGASRLRKACLNFKELCKKKEKDKLWMDELAAMEACSQPELYIGTSGVMLTSESISSQNSMPVVHESAGQLEMNVAVNDASSYSTNTSACLHSNQDNKLYTPRQEPSLAASRDNINGNPQAPIAWPNHPPQYMYGFQGPAAQRMSPYQGYAFPGMQFISPYYPGHSGNTQRPPEEFGHGTSQDADHQQRNTKPSLSKERSLTGRARRNKETTLGVQDGYSDQNSSNSGSESDADMHHAVSSDRETVRSQGIQKRASKKKSSRTVVIRNINYISSKRRDGGQDGSSDESLVEDDFLNGDFLKNKVENVVDSLQKHRKSTRHQYKKKVGTPNPSNNADPVENGPVRKACDVEKSDDIWKTFQNILMRDEESAANELDHENTQHQVEVGDEYCIIKSLELTQQSVRSCTLDVESERETKQQLVATDSITITERDANVDDAGHMENFECDENYCSSMKRSHTVDENLLYMQSTKPEADVQDALPDYSNEQSALRCQRGGDWFIVSRSDKLSEVQEHSGSSIFEGDQALTSADVQQHKSQKNEKKLLIDDSFMVTMRPAVNEQPISQWETDMSMVSGITLAAASCEIDNTDLSTEKVGNLYACEPDDLQMVLERDSGHESFGLSWIPETVYNAEITLSNANEPNSGAETYVCTSDSTPPSSKESKNNGDTEKKFKNKDSRGKPLYESLGKMKSDVLSRNRKPPTMNKATLQKSKIEKEEESRKRIEELLVERQKRITQRSTNYTITATTATVKENRKESKAATGSLNHEKRTSRSASHVTNRLKVHNLDSTNSTKDKHMSARSKQNGSSAATRATQPKRTSIKGDSATANCFSGKKTTMQMSSSSSENQLSVSDQTIEGPRGGFSSSHINSTNSDMDNQACQLQVPPAIEKDEQGMNSHRNTWVDGGCKPSVVCVRDSSFRDELAQSHDHSARNSDRSQQVCEEKRDHALQEANNCGTSADIHTTSRTEVYPLPDATERAANFGIEVADGPTNDKFPVSSMMSEIEVEGKLGASTPPPARIMCPEASYSRKKWTSNGGPPTAEGIKKLLFGGRSHKLHTHFI